MKLKLINILVIIIFIFCQDLRGQLAAISVTSINQLYASLRSIYTRGGTRVSSASSSVWAAATFASDEHPVIDEVAIHRHPASCNIGTS